MHHGGGLGFRDTGHSLKTFSWEIMSGDGVLHPHQRDVLGLGRPRPIVPWSNRKQDLSVWTAAVATIV